MNEQDIREQFEKWYTERFNVKYPESTFGPMMKGKRKLRDYFSDSVQMAYEAWQAATQSSAATIEALRKENDTLNKALLGCSMDIGELESNIAQQAEAIRLKDEALKLAKEVTNIPRIIRAIDAALNSSDNPALDV